MAHVIIIGFLFGFVLQRAFFCGATIISSVVLSREFRGVFGLLLAIFVSMFGFAALTRFEWVIYNPNPLRLLVAVIGGVTYGTGMVLAGGCVTGTLFKVGEGRLTSFLAMIGIGIGANVVDKGLLAFTRRPMVMATRDVSAPPGISEMVGVSYAAAAAVLGVIGLLAVLATVYRHRKPAAEKKPLDMKRIVTGGWSYVSGGIAVGVLGWAAYLSSTAFNRNYPLGAIGGVKGDFALLVGGTASASEWQMMLVVALVFGSAFSAFLRRELKLRSADAATLLFAMLGGVLVGAGATIGRGCFIGNMISGLALLSLHSVIFAVCAVLANWATTIVYLRGLR
jgi:uncharacterized membrane protein YedE/YeeE